MADVLDVNVSFVGKQANEVIIQPIMEAHAIETFFDTRPDITFKEQLALNTTLRRIIRKYTGCGFSADGDVINVFEKYLEVCKLKVNLEQCAQNIGTSFFVDLMKKGTDIDDLTDTEIQDFIVARVMESLTLDVPELTWFGDTDSVDEFLSSCDGIWKRIFQAIDEYSGQRLYVFGASLGECEALDAMRALYSNAPAELDAQPEGNKQILLTRELYDNYLNCREDACCGDKSWDMLEQGKRQLYFRGIPVYKMTEWTEAINFHGLDFPHRIMYTLKGNLVVGTDAVSSDNSLKFWYDEKDEMNYIKLKMKWGTQMIYEGLTVVGY